jgi:heat shock protein 90kDa beta
MMEIAIGGRWGRAEEVASEAEAEAEADEEVLSDSTSGEVAEAEVVEPSEVRAESDPWKD